MSWELEHLLFLLALRVGFYHAKFPVAEDVVLGEMRMILEEDPTLAPSLHRMHYHDCFVQRPRRRKRKRGKGGPRRPTIALLTEEAKQRLLRVVTPTSPGTIVSPFAPAPRRPQYPPFLEDGNVEDVHKWNDECHEVSKIIKKIEKERDKDIPIKTEPKDPYTTEAIQSSREKVVVLHAARAIVSISHIMDDGQRRPQCTGIIIKQWSDDTGHHHATIVTYSRIVCEAGRKRDPLPKKTVLDAELIYFNDHYDIALLHINLEVTMELPSFGRGPEYGQEVFVLARDGEASLRARRGDIQWLEESDILGRDHYMFLSCDIPEGRNGGMVIDNDGLVRGMAIYCSPYPAVTSISTIVKCIDMFMQFKTIVLLDVQLQEDISDFGIKGGFLVDRVYNPVAEDLGIKRGNVITSINGKGALTLPELEDYLLSLGWNYLEDKLNCIKDIKLRVCDLKSGVEIDVTLPVRFYDKSERSSLDVLFVFCHAADTSCKVGGGDCCRFVLWSIHQAI
uniref:Plant heme peroxidase family profile domain-containing protein n=1 Tax=Oryza glumipatula TaxID=40148 RepID=A0A0D9ZV97_9ORYZ